MNPAATTKVSSTVMLAGAVSLSCVFLWQASVGAHLAGVSRCVPILAAAPPETFASELVQTLRATSHPEEPQPAENDRNPWRLDPAVLAPFLVRLPPGQTAADVYANATDRFCNKCDFAFYKDVLLPLLPCCTVGSPDTAALLLGGLNRGQLAGLVLEGCPGPTLHGFEIQEDLYEASLLRYSALRSRVRVNNLGMSSAAGAASVGQVGGHETAGLYSIDPAPVAQRAAAAAAKNGTGPAPTPRIARTVRLDDYVDAKGLRNAVCAAIIDVEGHEAKVLQGMDLPARAAQFPVIAVELGGTWAPRDPRRAGSWLQADAARFLTNVGYRLYLIGADALLPVNEKFFADSRALDAGRGTFVQGNLLAMWAG